MKILFITSSSIQGGAQKHIRDMFQYFIRQGHDVYLVAPSGWLLDELQTYSSRLIPMKARVRNIFALQRVYEDIKPDVTNTFILSGGCFGVAAWKKKKYGKIFVTVNNPVIYDGISTIKKFVYPLFYRWMSRYASAFLVKSDKVKDEVTEIIQKRKPVISIKNGIDFSVFDRDKEYIDIRDELTISKEDIVITNVAALDIRKGQKYLIEAAIELRKKYPIHLLLVGEGNEEERLKKTVQEHNAEHFVHFLGRRNDINGILAKTNIFVLSSLHEGLPNALMEAMAMGIPCISSDVGGAKQLMGKAEGVLVQPKSVSGIIEGVKKIIHNSEYAKKIGENAFQKIRKDYSQDTAVQELEDLYIKY